MFYKYVAGGLLVAELGSPLAEKPATPVYVQEGRLLVSALTDKHVKPEHIEMTRQMSAIDQGAQMIVTQMTTMPVGSPSLTVASWKS
jgi:hypothetical protein